MGIMYKIRKVKGEPVFDNWDKLMNHDIVELEEIQEENEEALEEKYKSLITKADCYCCNPTELAQIAKSHFQSHPEELGLVRIEDVLKVFDETRRSIFPEAFSSPVYLLCFTDASKGLAHANPLIS